MAAKRSGKGPQGREEGSPSTQEGEGGREGGALSHINYFSSHPVPLVHGSACLSFSPLYSLPARSSSPLAPHIPPKPPPTPATHLLTVVHSPPPLSPGGTNHSPTHTITRKRARNQSLSTDFPEFHLPFTPPSLPYGKSIFHRGLGCRPWRQGSKGRVRRYVFTWYSMSRANLVITISLEGIEGLVSRFRS